MSRSFLCSVLLLVIAVGGLAIRLCQLDRRPLHHDEANQALRFQALQETGSYRYDPAEYHGPTLYYITLPIARLQAGRDFPKTTEFTFRVVPAIFGTLLILLLYLLRDGLGWPTVLCSALLTAISPAMVYYSRFFAQEMLLVCFTFGAITTGWWHVRTRTADWAMLAGAFLGLMYATKETCVIAYVAMAVAIVVVHWGHEGHPWPFEFGHTLAGVGIAGAFAVTLLCSFFTNPIGIVDSLRSFTVYLHRAGAVGAHVQPWYTYLQTLIFIRTSRGFAWSEGLIVGLAVVGAIAAWLRKEKDFGTLDSRLFRFFSVYTLLMTAAYSLIPYKTPWCMISFLQPMIVLAGFGAVTLVNACANKWAKVSVSVLLVVAACNLGWQSWRASFKFPADPRNPYVYAQTSADFMNLVRRVDQIAAVSPDHHSTLIKVIADPYTTWPMPWYFRAFDHVGYWTRAADVPDDVDAPIIICATDQQDALAPRLKQQYMVELYGLRPQVFLTIYIRSDLWDAFMKTRQNKKL